MVTNLVNLVTIAETMGKVTYAKLAADGSIFIDVEEDGVTHHLSYTSSVQENCNADS